MTTTAEESQSATGGGGQAAGCAREARAPAPAALPCQNSNNSDKPLPRYRLFQVPGQSNLYADREKKHVWDKHDEDTLHRLGKPTGAEARSAFHLRLNVASFIQQWARNHCLFFTVVGCTSVDVRPVSSKEQISQVVIRTNPKVAVADFLNVLISGFQRHGIATRVISNDAELKDEYVVNCQIRAAESQEQFEEAERKGKVRFLPNIKLSPEEAERAAMEQDKAGAKPPKKSKGKK